MKYSLLTMNKQMLAGKAFSERFFKASTIDTDSLNGNCSQVFLTGPSKKNFARFKGKYLSRRPFSSKGLDLDLKKWNSIAVVFS